MIRRIVEGGKTGAQFDLHIDGDRSDANYTLVRSGAKWDKPYQGSKSVKIVSDGNGVEVSVYTDDKGRRAKTIELDYAEAAELGMALIEYAKGDPFAPNPLYTVEDFIKPVEAPKKAKKTKRVRRENPLYGDRCGG